MLEADSASAPIVASAWDVLTKGVNDSDPAHRKTAIAALGTIGSNTQAVSLIEQGLQDKNVQVRQTSAYTLGEMGAKDAIPHLKAALQDSSPEVSFTAAKALWNLGDADDSRDIFQAVLEGERSDQPGKLQSAIRHGKKKLTPAQLALMGVNETGRTMLGPASIAIVAAEEAAKEGKKDSAAGGRIISAEVLSKDSDSYALPLLEWALGDSNWAVRLAVAKGLGERGNEATIVKLEPLLNDDRHAVRYMAAASIIKLSQKKAPSAN